jgi:hypothetical protein
LLLDIAQIFSAQYLAQEPVNFCADAGTTLVNKPTAAAITIYLAMVHPLLAKTSTTIAQTLNDATARQKQAAQATTYSDAAAQQLGLRRKRC